MRSTNFSTFYKVAGSFLLYLGKTFLLFCLLFLITSPAVDAHTPGKVNKVLDGDTIIAKVDGVDTTIRYLLIDTPELHHPKRPVEELAQEAREINEELVQGKTVLLEFDTDKKDRYGRMLSYVWIRKDKEMVLVNEQMVLKGYAVPMTIKPNDRYDDMISTAFRKARRSNAGLWSMAENRIFTAEQAWWEMPYIEGKFFILDMNIKSIIRSGSRYVILPEKGSFSVVVYENDWKECRPSIPEKGKRFKVLGNARKGYHGGELILADPSQILFPCDPK